MQKKAHVQQAVQKTARKSYAGWTMQNAMCYANLHVRKGHVRKIHAKQCTKASRENTVAK